MTPAVVAVEIREDAFIRKETASVPPQVIAATAGVLADGLEARMKKILDSKPWYWRLLFGHGLKFAVDVLKHVAAQIGRDYSETT